jgi:gamma-glutamyltranspeptidase/glutathione hydrolase
MPPDVGHTTHISVVDRERNLVSLTSTLGDVFGSAVIVPGTGILLNCGTTWFDPRPGTHNSIAPGRRILWAGSPAIVTREGKPLAAAGAPGGRKVISSVLQVVVNLIDYGLGIQDAVGSPRVHCEGQQTWVDSRLSEDVLGMLRDMGHDLVVQTETVATSYFGRPNGVVVDEATGTVRGGVSPFKPYYAVGI